MALGIWLSLVSAASLQAQADRYFEIQVVDAETGRGIPLVELRTTNDLVFVTDSAGKVAFDEPGLLGTTVFFHLASHGYEVPKDFLGQRGRAFQTSPGGQAKIELRRVNIAERVYRVTGQGIYADSIRLGERPPLRQPLISGLVTGQDSVQNAVLGETIYWFWGDTNRPSYPLGHFGTSAARSRLPSAGGLEPSQGVDLEYYVNEQGFSAPAFDSPGGILVWLDGVMVVPDVEGESRIVGHYNVMKSLGERLEHGLALFEPETGKFTKVLQWPDSAPLEPSGQVLAVTEPEGEFLYFCTPFPAVRVPARWSAIQDPQQYEALTPLAEASRFQGAETQLVRDDAGRLSYVWRRNTPALKPSEEARLIDLGLLDSAEAHWQVQSGASRKSIVLQSGNVSWNAFRQCYVLIAVQSFGDPSFLGEVWYAEAQHPGGPWQRAVKVVTHDQYSFYNPRHHPYFDEDGGRWIYFEGTYTSSFSKAKSKTPRYDYNQVMYRLDLSDPRLSPGQIAQD